MLQALQQLPSPYEVDAGAEVMALALIWSSGSARGKAHSCLRKQKEMHSGNWGRDVRNKDPTFFSTSDSIRGTRHHPTLFKHLHLQHSSANTANVLFLGSGTHWDDASNQAIKRPLSLLSEEEVVAELAVASGKGHGLKMSLNDKTR